MKKLLHTGSIWQNEGLGLIRIVTGFFMIYHGLEIFDTGKIHEYLSWDNFKNHSSGKILVYAGKAAELTGGLLFLLGLFTRIAAIILACTMLYISFFVGHGKIWYDDQHPFLFVLLALVFFFAGPGKWSVDQLIFKKQ